MPHYRIRFCNDLTNSNGHEFHTCQSEVTVRSGDEQTALELAKREYERREKITSWRQCATSVECEEIVSSGVAQ